MGRGQRTISAAAAHLTADEVRLALRRPVRTQGAAEAPAWTEPSDLPLRDEGLLDAAVLLEPRAANATPPRPDGLAELGVAEVHRTVTASRYRITDPDDIHSKKVRGELAVGRDHDGKPVWVGYMLSNGGGQGVVPSDPVVGRDLDAVIAQVNELVVSLSPAHTDVGIGDDVLTRQRVLRELGRN